MNPEHRPVIGQWYRHRGDQQAFQVVAVDDADGSVELQFFDGTVDELRLVQWYALDIEDAETPQDWTGPFDRITRDDIDATDVQMEPEDWNEPYVAAVPEDDAAAAAEPIVDAGADLLPAEMTETDPPSERLYAKAVPKARGARRRHH